MIYFILFRFKKDC